MTERSDGSQTGRREFLQMAGAAVGGAILLPYGCSESEVGVVAEALPTDYQFFKVLDLSQGLFDDLKDLTPGIMINDQDRILFYGDNGGDDYGLYELTIDFRRRRPTVAESRVIVATGSTALGDRTVQRIHRADTNSAGNVALLVDFYADGSGPAEPAALGTVFVEQSGDFERIVGFGDPAPGGGVFGAAFGDIAMHDDDDLLVVAHYADEVRDPRHGVFALPGAARAESRLLLNSGLALEGRAGPVARAFGLIDLHDQQNFVVQTQVTLQPPTLGVSGAPSESIGSLVQGQGLMQTLTAPRVLSAPPGMGLTATSQGSVVMGPRAGNDGAAAWIVHGDNDDSQQLFFRSDSRPVIEIATAGGASPIYSFSAPVLSDNGMLFYLQFNRESEPAVELKAVGAGAPTTILALGQPIDGQPITGLMHGYHSQQADSQGRVVVYAEFGEGNPAILVGIPG